MDSGPSRLSSYPLTCRNTENEQRRIAQKVLLCDLCNRILVSEKGEVLEDFVWTDQDLICRYKFEEFDKSDFQVRWKFSEGEEIPKDHEMFAPMKITWF